MNEQQPPPLPLLNTSGQGKAAVVPKEIQKWNWAAFILNWGIGNSVPVALVALEGCSSHFAKCEQHHDGVLSCDRERAHESKGRGSSWPGLFNRKERKERKDTGVMTGDELESL